MRATRTSHGTPKPRKAWSSHGRTGHSSRQRRARRPRRACQHQALPVRQVTTWQPQRRQEMLPPARRRRRHQALLVPRAPDLQPRQHRVAPAAVTAAPQHARSTMSTSAEVTQRCLWRVRYTTSTTLPLARPLLLPRPRGCRGLQRCLWRVLAPRPRGALQGAGHSGGGQAAGGGGGWRGGKGGERGGGTGGRNEASRHWTGGRC